MAVLSCSQSLKHRDNEQKDFTARWWVLLLLAMSYLGTGQSCYAGGWYVGNTAPGEWVQYTNVWLAGGHIGLQPMPER